MNTYLKPGDLVAVDCKAECHLRSRPYDLTYLVKSDDIAVVIDVDEVIEEMSDHTRKNNFDVKIMTMNGAVGWCLSTLLKRL